jgi:hypothetical protein
MSHCYSAVLVLSQIIYLILFTDIGNFMIRIHK